MTETTRRAGARVATESASKYLQQLCKHFEHKLPVNFDASAGAITFPTGQVQLSADAEALAITLDAPTDEDLERLKDVVARHLVRFAFRETLEVDWRAAA